MTWEEYRQMFLSNKPSLEADVQQDRAQFHTCGSKKIKSTNFDWRRKGVLGPIKNQGACGSCWAFSITATIEARLMIKNITNVSLSEQQMVECSTNNWGCSGGWLADAFDYVMEHGLMLNEDYPQNPGVDRFTARCKYNQTKARVRLPGYSVIPGNDEECLRDTIARKGPVAVAMDASHPSFMFYGGGVYDDAACSSVRVNHAVVIVGFGVDRQTKKQYWVGRNSWGEKWGERGYFRIARSNRCGLSMHLYFPNAPSVNN